MANARTSNAAEPADMTNVDDEQDDDLVEEEPEPEANELPAPTRAHAVWCITLNMGSCNGCDQQVQAMLAPRYQLAKRGITFASSPRHADIVLLTGVLTRRTLEPVRRVLAQIPDPHAIVAVGDCVINGSVFAGSPDILPDAADLLGVNVEIAGNPPTPAQIVRAIEAAARLLDAVDARGADDEDDAATDDDTAEDETDEAYAGQEVTYTDADDLEEDDTEADAVEDVGKTKS